MCCPSVHAARMYRCDLICWDMSFFPPCPILKLVWHTLQKVWALFTWLRENKLHSSVQLVLNLHEYFFSSSEHHLTLLLPFQPLMLDSTSRIYYLRRNLQRNWVVSLSLRRHAHGTLAKPQKWKHFRSFEVVLWFVELYRISGRRVSRSLTFRLETKMPWRQSPHERRKPSCLQLWRQTLIRIK